MAVVILRGDESTTTERLGAIRKFIIERERIRLLKESGAPRPWTDDSILSTYHFCNVRRADDRVTRWIGKWGKTFDADKRWFVFAVARWFNEPATLEQLPVFNSRGEWNERGVLKVLSGMVAQRKHVFRGSYIINGGGNGLTKYESVVQEVLTPLWRSPPPIIIHSIEQSWSELRHYRGMGSFMAGQIVADWQTFGVIAGRDYKTWAPLGPGSARGLRWIFDLKDGNIRQDDAVVLMRKVYDYIHRWPGTIPAQLTLHDVQNCLCEFSKYLRGYSKTTYRPYDEAQGKLL